MYSMHVVFMDDGFMDMTLKNVSDLGDAEQKTKEFADGFWVRNTNKSIWHPAHSIKRIELEIKGEEV